MKLPGRMLIPWRRKTPPARMSITATIWSDIFMRIFWLFGNFRGSYHGKAWRTNFLYGSGNVAMIILVEETLLPVLSLALLLGSNCRRPLRGCYAKDGGRSNAL